MNDIELTNIKLALLNLVLAHSVIEKGNPQGYKTVADAIEGRFELYCKLLNLPKT